MIVRKLWTLLIFHGSPNVQFDRFGLKKMPQSGVGSMQVSNKDCPPMKGHTQGGTHPQCYQLNGHTEGGTHPQCVPTNRHTIFFDKLTKLTDKTDKAIY